MLLNRTGPRADGRGHSAPFPWQPVPAAEAPPV